MIHEDSKTQFRPHFWCISVFSCSLSICIRNQLWNQSWPPSLSMNAESQQCKHILITNGLPTASFRDVFSIVLSYYKINTTSTLFSNREHYAKFDAEGATSSYTKQTAIFVYLVVNLLYQLNVTTKYSHSVNMYQNIYYFCILTVLWHATAV